MEKTIYLLIVLFVIGITGCSKKDSTIKTTGGNEVSTESKLPDDFPRDFPVYKDAKIMSTTKTGKNTTVTFEINDKAGAVGNFYMKEMPKAGYETDKENEMMMKEDSGIMSYKKGGKVYDLTYTYKESAGKTYLTVLVR